MTSQFLVGAILGSFVFIIAGRAPAERILAVVQSRLERGRRRP